MRAWTLQQSLSQILKLALADGVDPGVEPARFRTILAKTGGARGFPALEKTLERHQTAARGAYDRIIASD
jgi:glutamate-ammonia-ligase adenylyltransferase